MATRGRAKAIQVECGLMGIGADFGTFSMLFNAYGRRWA
jgi:hypothetical protein